MIFCSPLLFSCSLSSGRMRYAPTIFLMAQKQMDSYILICAIVSLSKMSSQMVNIHLPGVNDAFAIGNHGLKSEQNTSATCEMRVVSCAKRLSQPRKWNCHLRKTAIATAIMKLSHAQTLIATAIMKLSLAQTPIVLHCCPKQGKGISAKLSIPSMN